MPCTLKGSADSGDLPRSLKNRSASSQFTNGELGPEMVAKIEEAHGCAGAAVVANVTLFLSGIKPIPPRNRRGYRLFVLITFTSSSLTFFNYPVERLTHRVFYWLAVANVATFFFSTSPS